MTDSENIKLRCHDETLHCIGTASVFANRIVRLKRRLQALTFLGIAVPASVGAAATSFGIASDTTAWFLGVAGVLSVFQVILSVWALSTGWSDSLAVALEGQAANREIAEAYQAAIRDQQDVHTLKTVTDKIDVRNSARSRIDEQQSITDHELRYGMRFALRELKRECAGCRKTPTSLKPTDCDVCGNFKLPSF